MQRWKGRGLERQRFNKGLRGFLSFPQFLVTQFPLWILTVTNKALKRNRVGMLGVKCQRSSCHFSRVIILTFLLYSSSPLSRIIENPHNEKTFLCAHIPLLRSTRAGLTPTMVNWTRPARPQAGEHAVGWSVLKSSAQARKR